MSQSLGLRTFRPLLRQTGSVASRRPQYRPISHVRIQKVKFKRPLWSWKRVGTYALYIGVTYYTLTYGLDYLLGPLEEAEEKEWQQVTKSTKAQKAAALKAMDRTPRANRDDATKGMRDGKDVTAEEAEEEDEEGEEEEEEELGFDEEDIEDTIFIPMTWAKERPREYYRRSDPEWQEFVRFSQNRQRQKDVRDHLASQIRTVVERHPMLKQKLGQIDTKNMPKYWIDVVYPDGPPRDFERTGIEIIFLDDDTTVFAWSTKTVDQHVQRRLEHVLYPTAAYNALSKIGSGMATTYWARIKSAFGDKTQPPTAISTIDEGLQEIKRRHVPGGAGPGSPTPNQSPGQSPGVMVPPSSNGPPIPQQQAVPIFGAFMHYYMRGRKPMKVEPPRGSCLLGGMVQIVGSRAVCTLDVVAIYDPKHNKLTALNIGLKRLADRQQRPKGGE